MLFQATHASFLLVDNLIEQETGCNIICYHHGLDGLSPTSSQLKLKWIFRYKYEINCFKVALVMFLEIYLKQLKHLLVALSSYDGSLI